jgi:TusA-related sulfurtransferase
MLQIDTRGLSCPQPVVMVNRAIKDKILEFEVLLDSEASRENVARLLTKNKLEFKVREEDRFTVYIISK